MGSNATTYVNETEHISSYFNIVNGEKLFHNASFEPIEGVPGVEHDIVAPPSETQPNSMKAQCEGFPSGTQNTIPTWVQPYTMPYSYIVDIIYNQAMNGGCFYNIYAQLPANDSSYISMQFSSPLIAGASQCYAVFSWNKVQTLMIDILETQNKKGNGYFCCILAGALHGATWRGQLRIMMNALPAPALINISQIACPSIWKVNSTNSH